MLLLFLLNSDYLLFYCRILWCFFLCIFRLGANNITQLHFSIGNSLTLTQVDAPGKVLTTTEGHIEFRDVSFTYPARPDVPIFAGITRYVEDDPFILQFSNSQSSGQLCDKFVLHGKSEVVNVHHHFLHPLL